jgi:hypothetical protein
MTWNLSSSSVPLHLIPIRSNTNIHIEETTLILGFEDLQNMDRNYERHIRKFSQLGLRK